MLSITGIETGKAANRKIPGNLHWQSPKHVTDNSTGFKGFPGGYMESKGAFYNRDKFADWRTFTQIDSSNPTNRYLVNYRLVTCNKHDVWKCGYAVRCVTD
jgi:uncharacterized protein (TIGR02145 family)